MLKKIGIRFIAFIAIIATGCGRTTNTTAPPAASASISPEEEITPGGNTRAQVEADAAKIPSVHVVGQPVVLTNSYGLPGTTGYNTVVAFQVQNESTNLDALDVQYRVTVRVGETILTTTSGQDRFSVRAGETRPVVLNIYPSLEGTQPDSAEVQLYLGPSTGVPAGTVPDPTQWRVENPRISCDSSVIQCRATADITWAGTDPQVQVNVMVLAHDGADASGPIIAAGTAGIDGYALQTYPAGQTIPVSGYVTGFTQPQEKGPVTYPDTPVTPELYVESAIIPPGQESLYSQP